MNFRMWIDGQKKRRLGFARTAVSASFVVVVLNSYFVWEKQMVSQVAYYMLGCQAGFLGTQVSRYPGALDT